MQVLNYTRSVRESMKEIFPLLKPELYGIKKAILKTLDLLSNSQKFIMPDDGKMFSSEFKALPDVLNLPYPVTVLEFKSSVIPSFKPSDAVMFPNKAFPTKAVVIAEQLQPGVVCIYNYTYEVYNPITQLGKYKTPWMMSPYFAIVSIVGDTPIEDTLIKTFGIVKNPPGEMGVVFGTFDNTEEGNFQDEAFKALADSVTSVLSLVEVLSCSNIATEVVPARKQSKTSIKKSALPFDDYCIIKVGLDTANQGTSKGPIDTARERREHLRRGHIRRYPDKRIFVKACVVNAGKGGFIKKDYTLRKE